MKLVTNILYISHKTGSLTYIVMLQDFLKFKQICWNSQLRSQNGYDIRWHKTAKPTLLNLPQLLPYTDHLHANLYYK